MRKIPILAALMMSLALPTTASACTQTTLHGQLHLGVNSTHFGLVACATETNGSLSAAEEQTSNGPWSGGWLHISTGSDFFSFEVEPAGPITGTLAQSPPNTHEVAGPISVPLEVAWEPWAALHIRCRIAGFTLKGTLSGHEVEPQSGTLETTEAFSPTRAVVSPTCPSLIAWFLNEWLLDLHPGVAESATATIEVGSGAKPL